MTKSIEFRQIECGEKIPTDFEPEELMDLHATGQTKAYTVSFDSIEETFTRETGLKLPGLLTDYLGMKDLKWQLVYNPRSLSSLWVGGVEPDVSLQQVRTAICFDRINDYSKMPDGKMSLRPDTVFPGDLRVVGVYHPRAKRVIAAHYHLLYGQNDLVAFNVSLSEEEKETLKNRLRASLQMPIIIKGKVHPRPEHTEEQLLDHFNRLFPDLSASAGGLITEAMMELTSDQPPINSLTIRQVNKYRPNFGHSLYYDFDQDQLVSLKEMGFDLRPHPVDPGGNPFPVLVRQNRLPKYHWDISWRLIVPTFLNRVFDPEYPYF